MKGGALRWMPGLLRVARGAGLPEVDRAPAGPLAVLARITGAERGFPWLGAGCAVVLVAAARMLAAPLLAKLMAVLLAPVVVAWIAGFLAIRLTARRQHWAVCWAWAIAALVLGVLAAAIVHIKLATPNELILFSRRELLALVSLVWGGALALPLAILQRQAYRNELAALRLSALGAQLQALQAQVEPHFLYNTLANTRYLARHQPERAVAMLDHLIAYLHRALPDMRARTSTVRRECEMAEHYLALMAVRFGERMRYAVEVDEAVADVDMPPLLLISLVENAVRHGVEPALGTVTVQVRAAREGGRLRLGVVDDGPGPGHSGPTGNGVGLRNARDRLAALYGDAAGLTLTRGADQYTCAELLLPISTSRA